MMRLDRSTPMDGGVLVHDPCSLRVTPAARVVQASSIDRYAEL